MKIKIVSLVAFLLVAKALSAMNPPVNTLVPDTLRILIIPVDYNPTPEPLRSKNWLKKYFKKKSKEMRERNKLAEKEENEAIDGF